jgi:hypothetical protein
MTTPVAENNEDERRVSWWHATFREPCSSGPAKPDDALCSAHRLLVVAAGTNGWPMHVSTPAGQLIEALGTRSMHDLDTVTAVVDRLGPELTADLADAVRAAVTRAQNRVARDLGADVGESLRIPDAVAHDARTRLGYRSAVDMMTAEQLEARDELHARQHEDAAHYIDGGSGSGWPR